MDSSNGFVANNYLFFYLLFIFIILFFRGTCEFWNDFSYHGEILNKLLTPQMSTKTGQRKYLTDNANHISIQGQLI